MGDRLFFDDAKKIAQYAKDHCKEETERAIRAADNMANNIILFDLRWDMERTHAPVAFDGEIDWLFKPGDDPEWTFALNRMRAWVCMGQAYVITGDEKYPRAFSRQMLHWTKTVRREDPKAANAWRTIETGIRLESWIKAYCCMDDSPSLSGDLRKAFAESIAEHAEYILSVWNSFNLISNWGVLANHGLFIAGCFLPQSARAKQYASEAIERLARAIEVQVYPDGVHWEQSPMYHNEVLRCFLDVIVLAKKRQIALPPIIAEKTKAMLRASLFAGKPNGHEIMMGDSDDIDQRDLLTMGAYIFNDGNMKFAGYPCLDFDSAWTLGYDAISEYEKIIPLEPAETAQAFFESGNFYSRSDWSAEAAFVHFHCGTLGGGHGHADKLHVDVFYRGEDILIDPGRFNYVSGEPRYFYKRASAHSTTAVDGTDLYACAHSWQYLNLSRAVGQKFVEKEGYVYMEGAHLGYMEQGVYVCRRAIHIKPDILLLCDEFYGSADRERVYRQYFQWNNKGIVSGDGNDWNYRSEKNIARLALLSSHEIKAGLAPGRISRQYNQEEESLRLQTMINATGFASVFSVIALDPATACEPFSIAKETVYLNSSGIECPSAEAEAVTICKDDKKYTVVIAHREYTGPTNTFAANGCVGFGNVIVFDPSKQPSKHVVLAY
ncbi:MAG: heparinase II/III family protein [Treponema sp.]|nr:heparinase II/III family protein [Treponema sp.]